jgi:hypothetical protein
MPKPFQKVAATSAPPPFNQKQHELGSGFKRSLAKVTARSVESEAG